MSITTFKKVTVEGPEYLKISDALELARRYIGYRRESDRSVDEFSPKQIAEIESAMDKFWD